MDGIVTPPGTPAATFAAARRPARSTARPRLRRAAFWAAAVAVPPACTAVLLRHTLAVVLAAGAVAFVVAAARRPATVLALLVPLSTVAGAMSGGRYLLLPPAGLLVLLAAPRVLKDAFVLRRTGTRRALRYGGVLAGFVVASLLFPLVPKAMPLPTPAPRLSQIVPRFGVTVPDAIRFGEVAALLTGLLVAVTGTVTPPRPGRLARMIALTGAVAAVYALAVGDTLGGRLQGLGCNPNYLGSYLAVPLVACAGLARTSRGGPLWAVPAVVCLAGVAATESRGAVLATVAGLVVIFMQSRGRWTQAMVLLAGAWVAIVFPGALDALTHLAASERTAGDLALNNEIRSQVAHVAARAAVAHPVNGVGWGMFPTYAFHDPGFNVYIETHDDFLRLAAETGAGALAAFVALLWCGVRRPQRDDLMVLRAVVVTFAVGMLFANPLDDLVVSTPFWAALGCLLARVPATRARRRHPSRAYDLASRRAVPSR